MHARRAYQSIPRVCRSWRILWWGIHVHHTAVLDQTAPWHQPLPVWRETRSRPAPAPPWRTLGPEPCSDRTTERLKVIVNKSEGELELYTKQRGIYLQNSTSMNSFSLMASEKFSSVRTRMSAALTVASKSNARQITRNMLSLLRNPLWFFGVSEEIFLYSSIS